MGLPTRAPPADPNLCFSHRRVNFLGEGVSFFVVRCGPDPTVHASFVVSGKYEY